MTKTQEKAIMTQDELRHIAANMLQEAKKRGADQSEVSIVSNLGFTVSVHGGDVETIEYHQDKSIAVAVYFGNRTGTAGLSDLSHKAIADAVEAACHIAKFTGEDSASGLADKEDLGFDYPELKQFFPWNISVEDAVKLAVQCERTALDYDKRVMSAESVDVNTMASNTVYANSLGFTGAFAYTRHELSCVCVAKGENNEMEREYSYTNAISPTLLSSPDAIAKEAAERSVNRLGARSLSTRKAPVIFAAEIARGLLGHFASAVSGGSIYRKASFLTDQLNKKIFPDFIRLEEQPLLPMALGSMAFDDDGVLTRPNVFVDQGYLKQYALGVYSARKLGLKTTGNAGGMHNLTISHGDKNLAQLLKTMGTGLLVTEVMGQGVNIITGDYSRGAAGFWVENGIIQYPVHEITIAGKLQDIYARVVEVGNDVDRRGNILTGSILIDEMMIGGE